MIESWDFATIAWVSATLVGILASYLGVFMVLRKVTFVGIAMAQLATAGIGLSGLLEWPLLAGATLTMVLGVGALAGAPERLRFPRESLIGATYAAAGAGAILFTTFAPHADADMLGLLFGNILGVTDSDIYAILVTLIVLGLVHLIFHKEFLLVAFDPEMAGTMGYNVRGWNMLFYLTLGLAIAVSIHSAGVLLVFSLLVFPPLTGLAISHRWGSVCWLSLLTAMVAVSSGSWASVHWDLPTGATISALCFALWLLAWAGRCLGERFSH